MNLKNSKNIMAKLYKTKTMRTNTSAKTEIKTMTTTNI